ncbi:MAG: hypothetical protein V3R52_01490 [Candidatus Neomarinimicrobiota bacterium]
MKIPLKTKIAFWWWQKFRFKEPENKFQKISTIGEGIKTLLIIFPRDDKYLPLAQHFIKSIVSRGQINAIKKIISWEKQKYAMDKKILSRFQLISENDINKFGLLTDAAIKRLTNEQFDCVINLDHIFNPVSFQLVGQFSSITRIGFDTDYGNKIYNIFINGNRGTNYMEQGYEYILEVLGL